MTAIKAIETYYKGYRFRSRLEARWAVFFDACGIDWEYEPEGFDLGDGTYYLPDFLLHGVAGRSTKDLYVEVKGVMTKKDKHKIEKFSEMQMEKYSVDENTHLIYPEGYIGIYVVGRIPTSDSFWEIIDEIGGSDYCFYNFEYIDGDYFQAYPAINKDGRFELLGDALNYLHNADEEATERAFRMAKQARFEHGETPYFKN